MNVIKLTKSLAAWRTPKFAAAFKLEVASLGANQLPLQSALAHSSYVADDRIEAVILQSDESDTVVRVKTGIFFNGVVAGSCCADDPTSICEQAEYCELEFRINKVTADTQVMLLDG
ncbi:MAG: hypothetical protein P8Z75_03120 [Gammaproteobacteria bacterium]